MADKVVRSAGGHSLDLSVMTQSRGAAEGDSEEEWTQRKTILGYCEMIEPLKNLHPTIEDLIYNTGDQNGINNEVSNGVNNGVNNGVSNGVGYGVSNGVGNGVSNGESNGVSNGVSNGISNGKSNGLSNGVSNEAGNGVGNQVVLQLDLSEIAVENEGFFINYDTDMVLCDDPSTGKRLVRRSTSLKSGKTPPGTPSRKKIVRFADALGLDLTLVRTFLDDIPVVPQSAFDHLDAAKENATFLRCRELPTAPQRSLIASFTQPATLPSFLEAVKRQHVCLETATMFDEMTIRGVVRVLNVDFFKSVLIRFTIDEWITHTDVPTTYVAHSCDGLTDRFTFNLLASILQPGQRLIFAVCYRVGGKEFWDSNNGSNYVFQCVSNSNLPDNALHSPVDSCLPYI